MSITRVNEFIAMEGKAEALGDYLASIVPVIEACDGCMYCHLLRGHDNPSRFLIIETWEDIATHQLSVQGIDRKEFMRVMTMLAETPKAEYFQS
ncbi:MAG TPA: antibiotic biosynthesis monooxygenase [Gammaproteobacteria bacterium]